MHIFMAAVYTNGYKPAQARWEKLVEVEQGIIRGLPHVLESYHYINKQKILDEMRADGAKVFLDSGAFSAHTLGAIIKVSDYCDFVKSNSDLIRVEDGIMMASVLDGIGDALQTYRNQLEMEWRGVTPLPCFHFGEDERYLEYYLANYDYITIGGMVGKSSEQLKVWLDRIFGKYIIDGSGRPRAKFHGFGITAIPIMERYPWYSCDSSSWIQSAAFGSVVHPKHGPLSVSDKSPARHDKGRHISTLTAIEQKYVHDEFEKIGFSYERMSTIYESRAAYNLWAYGQINVAMDVAHDKNQTVVQELF